MNVFHVGPPLARLGGPAGYLRELEGAARAAESPEHRVRFPSPRASSPVRHPGALARMRQTLGRFKRRFAGTPAFYRPPVAALRSADGLLAGNMRVARREVVAEAGPSLEAALPWAETLFTHDPFCAEAALERRRPGQRVWMMGHAPMPMALYLAWNWGMPEWDWREFLTLPDVRRWIDWELELWQRVDLVVLPCREAGLELARVDSRFDGVVRGARHLLTGASGPAEARPGLSRDRLRRIFRLPADRRVGLFLGSAQPYRGLDALLCALPLLPEAAACPGVIAVAGPEPGTLPADKRLRALGRVQDVAGLLRAVDFVVNVNRLSLFDLSLIEAAQAGKPMLLHAVGGNRTFQMLQAGCAMLQDLEPATVAAGLTAMFTTPAPELDELGRASRACWEHGLTPAAMWRRHLALYGELAGAWACGAVSR